MSEQRRTELLQRLTPIAGILKADDFKPGPDADATTLLSERVTLLDEQGRRTSLRQVAYRSLNDAGVRENAKEVISYRKKEQAIHLLLAETIQADGTRQPVKPEAILIQSPQRQAEYSLYDDQAEMTVIFPNVKPGSVTHMIVVVQDLVAKVPGEFTQTIVFGGGWDLLLGRYLVDLPAALAGKLKIETLGSGVPAPVITRREDGGMVYTWEVRRQRGKRYEMGSPPLGQVGPATKMGTFRSWDDIARWYLGLVDGRNTVGPALAKAADAWIAGLTKPAEIINALHRNVADQVRYVGLEFGAADYQPHSCDSVWENQYGDCKDKANLLVALLNRCGIRAYIALVNTEHAGLIDRRVPTYYDFDHAIVAVADPLSGYVFCDPTLAYSEPGMLGPGSSDRDVLVLKDSGAEWVRTPRASAGTLAYQFDLKLANTGELSGWLNKTAAGFYGAIERSRLVRLDAEDLKSEMSKTVRGFFAGADVMDCSREQSARAAPYAVKAYFIQAGPSETATNTHTLVFPFSPGLLNEIGDRGERQTSFYTWEDTVRVTATIRLPPGWHATKVPSPFESESEVIACRARWHFEDGKCTTELTVETKRSLIKPGEFKGYYQSLLAFRSWLAEPVLLAADAAVAKPPGDTGELDLPRMPSGDGQIDLVDRLYPYAGDAKKRAQALMRTMQYFPDHKRTLFRAGVRLAVLDWDAGRCQDAHERLKTMLAKYANSVDGETLAWAEYVDGLVLRDLHQDQEAIARLRQVVSAAGVSTSRRADATAALADFLFGSDPAAALADLTSIAALPDGATPRIESRLVHALLLAKSPEELRRHLQNLADSHPDSAEELVASIVGDAATWTLSGDDRRRQDLVESVDRLFPQPGKALHKAVDVCRKEANLDRLQRQMLQMLAEKEAAPTADGKVAEAGVHGLARAEGGNRDAAAPAVRPAADLADPNGELAATLRMISAHGTLRSAEVGSPVSESNRRVMGIMIAKSAHGPVRPTPRVPPVPPPAPADLVGTLDGHFEVDNRGAAQYDLTLRLPEGRAGFTPSLTVTYYSGSGDGVLGRGFSFSTGFPEAVTRGRTLLARDGEVRSMQLGADDRLYLDGKRLLCVSPAGSYGKPGSNYRTEVDSFATLAAAGHDGMIETFVETQKSGRKLIFGKWNGEADAYQCGVNEEDDSLDAWASTYALKRVEDPQGNTIEFGYTHEGFGDWVLSRIAYAGRPGSPPPYTIEFTYAKKNHPRRLFHTLRRGDSSHILESIVVTAGPARVPVARYTPHYEIDPISGRYLLTAFAGELSADIGKPLVPLPPTRFTWSKTALPGAPAVAFALPTAVARADGYNPFAAADFSGEGRLDYVDARDGLLVYRSTRSGFGAKAEKWLDEKNLGAGEVPSEARTVLVGDVNGDLKRDVLVVGPDAVLHIAVSTGTAFKHWSDLDVSACLADPPAAAGAAPTHRLLHREGASGLARIVVADLNGDGRDDVLVHGYDGRLYAFFSNGTALVPSAADPVAAAAAVTGDRRHALERDAGAEGGAPPPGDTVRPLPVDLNDDGLADYAWVETRRAAAPVTADGRNELQYRISRRLRYVLSLPRGGFSAPVTIFERDSGPWMLNRAIPNRQDAFCVLTGDFNGDDLPDFLVTDAADGSGRPTWTMILSRGPTVGEPPTRIAPVAVIKRALPGAWSLPGGAELPALPDPVASAPGIPPGGPSAAADERARDRLESGAFNVAVLDLNRDGADDFVWFETGRGASPTEPAREAIRGWWVAYSRGDGSFAFPEKLTGEPWQRLAEFIEGAQTHRAAAASGDAPAFFSLTALRQQDVNGDGIADLVAEGSWGGAPGIFATADGAPAPAGRCPFPDFVTAITNGYGATSSIGYRAGKDELIYTAAARTDYPIADLRSSQPVVSDIWHGTEGAHPSHFSYQYAGNRIDLSGRGTMGFNAFITHDRQTNFLKYQFLVHSFPMTGIAAREQTLWLWEANGKTYLKYISSLDNQVTFDAVRDPFNNRLYGTVFPFTAKSVEVRSPADQVADLASTSAGFSGDGEHGAFMPKELPAALKFRTVSEFWHDDQDLAEPPPGVCPAINVPYYAGGGAAAGDPLPADFLSNGRRLPGRITAGNVTRSIVTGSGSVKSKATLYRPRVGPDDPLAGLVEAEVTSERTAKGLAVAPVESYAYGGASPLIQSETTDARAASNGDPKRVTEVAYRRDDHGRTLEKTVLTVDCSSSDNPVAERVSYQGSEFDDTVDLATNEVDADGDRGRVAYNPLFRETAQYINANGGTVVVVHDPLGRVVSVTGDADGYAKRVEYAWTTPDGAGWRQMQKVRPPPSAAGLVGESLYAMRVAETNHPTITTYYDRKSRVVRVVTEAAGKDRTSVDTAFNELDQEVATSDPYHGGGIIRWHEKTYDGYGVVERETVVDQAAK